MGERADRTDVVIVGAGFAGLGCARALAKHRHVHVTLSTATTTTSSSPCSTRWRHPSSPARTSPSRSTSCSTRTRTWTWWWTRWRRSTPAPAPRPRRTGGPSRVTPWCWRRARGRSSSARRAPPSTPSRSTRSSTPTGCAPRSSRCSTPSQRDPSLVDEGALTFVVVGAGATGTEIAGALAEMITHTMPVEYPDLDLSSAARVVMVDHGAAVLGPFSEHAHDYAAGVLERNGVDLRLRTKVEGGRPGPRAPVRRLAHPHAHGDLGGRHRRRPAGGRQRPADRARRARAGRARPEPGRAPGCLRPGRPGGDPRRGRRRPPPAGVGRAPVGPVDRQEHPRRRGRQADQALPLQGQGHHGHDRPQLRGGRGRPRPPRGGRHRGLRDVARRARDPDDRRPPQGRRLHRLGLGLLLQPPAPCPSTAPAPPASTGAGRPTTPPRRPIRRAEAGSSSLLSRGCANWHPATCQLAHPCKRGLFGPPVSRPRARGSPAR